MHVMGKPKTMSKNLTTDDQFRRNVISSISIALCVLMLTGTALRHLASPMPMRIIVTNCIIAIIFAITPILGRKCRNPDFMALAFFLGYAIMIGNGGLVAGGINAPICAALPLLPVMGFCFGGKKLGIAGLLIAFALVGGLLFAENKGWAGSILDPATVSSQRATNFLSILLGSFAIGLTYESSRRRAELRIIEISRLASLGTLAGGIAHEINNPLTILMGYTSQLKMFSTNKEIEHKAIVRLAERMENASNRIAKIVSGLRTYARDETGESFSEVRLKSVIESAVALIGEKFKNANIIVKMEKISDESLQARIGQATEVLLNLLNNAFDAVVDQKVKWIEISSAISHDCVEVSVTDSGPGIPVHLHTKIFAPFFTTKEIGKGTGLGLSTSSSIMHQHGGEIVFDANCPSTRFILRFKKFGTGSLRNEVAS